LSRHGPIDDTIATASMWCSPPRANCSPGRSALPGASAGRCPWLHHCTNRAGSRVRPDRRGHVWTGRQCLGARRLGGA